jgi:hypothetical protein
MFMFKSSRQRAARERQAALAAGEATIRAANTRGDSQTRRAALDGAAARAVRMDMLAALGLGGPPRQAEPRSLQEPPTGQVAHGPVVTDVRTSRPQPDADEPASPAQRSPAERTFYPLPRR